MLASVEGVYRGGKIELTQIPEEIIQGTPVIVTFLASGYVDLREHGIDKRMAAELRARLATFAEDWNDPAMDVYDTYESAKADL